MRRRPEHLLTLGVSLGALGALGIALLEGSVDIPATEVARLLFQDDGSIADRIVNQLRLPRALTAFGIGGMLAVAGVLMQVLLRNPLGDPYVLGVSGGAAVAVLAAMLAGVGAFWLPPLAFGGALASMLVVFLLAQRGEDPDNRRLLLTGIVMAAGWSALIGLVLSLAPPLQLPGMLFWLMGDLGGAPRPGLALGVLASGLAGALWLAPQLNLAGFGMAQAAALGVDPRRLRSSLFVLSSLLTAGAVAIAGAIGFVGLVTPHLVRLLGATDHRWLLPLSALLGGSLLVLADTLARTLIAPAQLPVGVLTALLGVPIFLWLLNREGRS
ncbi:FecCD family ABC transporter permease [endosymbiont of unidentified scaly snail isolate Monju]|uniref:FecCD family ABC transporter permease n=1 Tax=endosymbiont of unidentified scaly snail isolate Monju TaxID=1248727 RepID=UPI00038921C7|nr:iron ABC transporter permease [endosymbiont of unidentified scaly snail isolate Monju]BAN68440.1 iron complex ABC transporter permease [endosymbiont of unidentified scaly snail isolate Monju]